MSLSTFLRRTGRSGVRLLDAVLVRCYRVEVFADEPECILRSSVRRLKAPVGLPGGARLESGDKLIEIHFWNEHLPPLEESGADLPWGRRFARRLWRSLELLAAHAVSDPRYKDFVALHGRLGFIPEGEVDTRKPTAWRFGFELEVQEAPGMRFWTASFWAGLHAWLLMWAFNPNTLAGKRFRETALSDLWMTRDVLLDRFGHMGSRDAG